MEVALAAVKLAHEAGGPESDEQEIPAARPERESAAPGGRGGAGRPPGGGSERGSERGVERGPRRTPDRAMQKLFVGGGRVVGLRPQDLVGAITGETSLSGRDVGGIEIGDRFALVEVPRERADEVVAALRATLIKGKRLTVRLDRSGPPPRR